MRITRSTLRRLIAEESARLLREAAEEEITTTNEAERGKKRKKRGGADCLYVLFSGRGAYFYTAPCGLSEDEAAATGNNVTDDVVGGEDDAASSLDLYDWLGRHDEITAVYDFESAGGEVSKDDYMAQLEDVARSDGLLADDEFVNEEDADTAENDDLNEADDEPLDEMEDQEYNEYLQQQHGRFTSPENVKGTPEYGARLAAGKPPMTPASVPPHYEARPASHHYEKQFAELDDYIATGRLPQQGGYVSRRSEWGDADLYGGPPRVDEAAFPEELEGIYGEEPPEFDEMGPSDDSFLDYDPEEIPDMDDQYDPDYYEGLDDEGDDEDFVDYETGEDDVPYGAADVALRQGRGHRTDEGHDHDMDDYEHAYAMGGGSDEEGFAIDYDTGRPSPFAAKMFGQPAAGADDIEGADADEDVFGDDDMGRRGAMDDYHHAYKLGGGRDEEGFAADYDTGKKRQFPPARGGISEARWAKLAGILKG